MNVKFNSLKVIGILVLVLCGSVFGQEDTKNNKDKTSRSNATVNPTSLGLELSIPLGNVPGRAGSSTPIVLNYSSKLWQTDKYRINLPSPAEYVNAIYGDQSDSGWTTNLQAIYFEDSTISRFTISNGNGGSSGGGTVRAGSCCHPKLPVLDCDHTCEPQTTISSSATNTFSYDVIPRYTVHFPDGSTHDLVNSLIPFHVAAYERFTPPDVYYSIDGSNLRFQYNPQSGIPPILSMSDGSYYRFFLIVENNTTRYVMQHFDADGNKTVYQFYFDPSRLEDLSKLVRQGELKDTMGRTILSPKPPTDPNNSQVLVPGEIEYDVPGLSSVPMKYIFRWKRLENSFAKTTYIKKFLHELFTDNGPDAEFNPVVLQEIEQPNHKKYEFFYNEYGEIEKIIYPTGSAEEFEYSQIKPFSYAPFSALSQQGNRGVTKRTVMPDGDATHNMVWRYNVGTLPYRVNTVAPDGSRSERYLFSGTPRPLTGGSALYLPSQMPGKPYEERSYNQAGILVSRSITKWLGVDSPPTSGGCTVYCGGGGDGGSGGNQNIATTTNSPTTPYIVAYPRVEKQISISFEGDKALATLSESEYDSNADPMFFAQMNVKRAKSYGYVPLELTTAKNNNFASIQALFTTDKLLGSSETDYLYDAAYKARGILGLPTESRSYYKNEITPISRTQTVFDDTAVVTSDALTGNAAATWIDPLSTFRGKPTTSRVWNADTSTWIETKTFYDQYGNVRKTKTPTGIDNVWNESFVEYSTDYACAYPTKTISPAPSVDGTHGTTATSEATMTYDFATGLPLTVTDEYNQTVKTEYDAYLRPKKVSGVYPFVIPITETFYDDVNLSWVKIRKQIDEQNWDEATTFTDSLGRTIRTQAKDSQGDVFTETKYDNLGRVAATSNPYRLSDPEIYWSKPRYDELNRVVETYAPAIEGQPGASLGVTEFGISTVQDFVGTYTTATDASGRRARSITNALGQLVRIDEPTGINNDLGLIGSPNQPTFYKYNSQGKMVKVSQGQQNRYFLYDYLGRLIRVRQPEQEVNSALDLADTITNNNQWTAGFEYDIVGNLKKTTDAKGSIITNSYDKAGRVTLREYNNLHTPSVNYYYDGTGLATPPPTTNNFAKGKLTKVMSSISTTQYTSFDNFGRNLVSQQLTDGQTYESKYKYDFGGRMVEQTYPSGKVVRNFFENDGDLTKIVRQGKVYASDFAYTASGSLDRLKLGNGRWESWKYNSRQQLTEIALGTQATDGSLWKQNYEYGELVANGTIQNTGNISKITSSVSGLANPFIQTFKYDALDRIAEAKETNNGATTWQQSWNYDRFGNRLSFNSNGIGRATINTTPQVDQNTNRFVSGVQYDKTGNVVQDTANGQVRNFIFNGDNKQVHVKDVNNVAIGTYFYDGEGKRVKKTTASETTVFVYDGGGKLVAEYSTATPPTTPTVSYTATDTLGSPRVITDKNGNVTSRRDFMPFGEELTPDGAFRTSTNKFTYGEDNIRKRFTGYEKDQETGLDFAEARYYNNVHGRFTAVDPLLASGKSGNPQSFNRYAYTMNQPLVMTDKTGLQTEPADDVISVETYWNKAKDEIGTFVDYMRSLGQANRASTYNTGGEQNFEQRVGSSRVSRDISTFVNPTTAPGFREANRRYEKAEPYINAVPVLGSTANLGKSIWLGGNGSKNKLEVATNGALFAVDFATSFSGIAGGGIKAVGKVGFRAAEEGGGRAIALGLERYGDRMVLNELAEKTGAATFKQWSPDLTRRSIRSNFGRAFNQATERTGQINFALDGLLDDVGGAVKNGGRGFIKNNFTNAELNTVYSSPSLFNKTQFFFENRPISPLFRPSQVPRNF